MEQAKLNGIAEPIEQKNAYYNMYKQEGFDNMAEFKYEIVE